MEIIVHNPNNLPLVKVSDLIPTQGELKDLSKENYAERNIRDLDSVFAALLRYYKKIPALSIAIAQNGDFIGGGKGSYGKRIRMTRKCMNTFFCSTLRPFSFLGRINEDVNTYTRLGSAGHLFLTVPNVAIHQVATQKNKGGMTDVYLASGTYVKSFFSVMYVPSAVKVSMMGDRHRRLHHRVKWNNCVPKIIREQYRKG